MVPTRAFAVRETLILILFGIILVPIAAKRAQDHTRGYRWQLQQHAASSASSSKQTTNKHDFIASPLSSLTTTTDADLVSPPILYVAVTHQQQQLLQNDSVQASAPPPSPSAPRAAGAVTIRFGAAEMTAEDGGGVAMATAAPRIPGAALRGVEAADAESASTLRSTTTATATAAAKASDASSKGRWTLIWMGSAIAAVAGLMSLC